MYKYLTQINYQISATNFARNALSSLVVKWGAHLPSVLIIQVQFVVRGINSHSDNHLNRGPLSLGIFPFGMLTKLGDVDNE